MRGETKRKDSKSPNHQTGADHVEAGQENLTIQQQLLPDKQVSGKKSKNFILAQEMQQMDDPKVNSNNLSQNPKQLTASGCFRCSKWNLILLMLFAIITAILVAIYTIPLLDNQDQCLQQFPAQQSGYKLFSTKTTYQNARDYLEANEQKFANLFGESNSLSNIHQRLTEGDLKCKLRQLHYIGRHASRYPSHSEASRMIKSIEQIQALIDLDKFSPNDNLKNRQLNAVANESHSTGVCFNPMTPYKQWLAFFSPELNNTIMDSGFDEAGKIAARLSAIYPEMFDSAQTNIKIGLTDEIRTAQTALMFLKEIKNFTSSYKSCDLNQLPGRQVESDSTSSSSNKDQAAQVADSCYRMLIRDFYKEKLKFHKICSSKHQAGEETVISFNYSLFEPMRIERIVERLSKKLKLDQPLSDAHTRAMYDVCKYETAYVGSSIWCNLFLEEELKFFEYINDIDDYLYAFGHDDLRRSACPVTSELMKSFLSFRDNKASPRYNTEAHFYFTHSEAIQRILAASVNLKSDPGYSRKAVRAHLDQGTAPEERQWRTSLMTPFASNIAFSLYECEKTQPNRVGRDGELVFDTRETPFKVVASLNEKPIKLEGCPSVVCDLATLEYQGRLNQEKECKLEDICRSKIVIT